MLRERYDPAVNRLVGVVASRLGAAHGLWVLASGEVTIKGRYGGALLLTGFDALLYVGCILSLAAAINCFSLWPVLDRLADYAGAGAALALAIFIALLAVLVSRQ